MFEFPFGPSDPKARQALANHRLTDVDYGRMDTVDQGGVLIVLATRHSDLTRGG